MRESERIATGTDAGGAPVRPGSVASEVELLVRTGLEPYEAITAATRAAGEVLGRPEVGTLAAGAPADFMLVEGDPLSDVVALRRVRPVYRSGERVGYLRRGESARDRRDRGGGCVSTHPPRVRAPYFGAMNEVFWKMPRPFWNLYPSNVACRYA